MRTPVKTLYSLAMRLIALASTVSVIYSARRTSVHTAGLAKGVIISRCCLLSRFHCYACYQVIVALDAIFTLAVAYYCGRPVWINDNLL